MNRPGAGAIAAIVDRPHVWADRQGPAPKLPWGESGFSERMLAEHLSQAHDRASRRFEIVDDHAEWIWNELLGGRPGRVLDLGCGPGLYSTRLARRGCRCVGIDFSPASIEYARVTAGAEELDCTFRLEDLATADLGSGHDLAMFVFGELNTCARGAVADLLRRTHAALRPGGHLLLEVSSYDSVREGADEPDTWFTAPASVFSPVPHLVLTESAWDEAARATRWRHLVVEAGTGTLSMFAEEQAAYRDDELRHLLEGLGFVDVEVAHGRGPWTHPGMMVITTVAGPTDGLAPVAP